MLGGVAGGIILFLANWFVYGILLKNYMAANYNQCFMKPMEDMTWWALILSNLSLGFLLTIVISWSNSTSVIAGAKVGGILGLLFTLFIDLQFYAMSNMFHDLSVVFVDLIASVIILITGGAVIAWVMAMDKKEE